MPLVNPFAWLTGRALKSVAPALLTLLAVGLIAFALWSATVGLVALVRSEAAARYEGAIADSNATATAAQAARNEAAAQAEAQAREMADAATGERERVLALEAEIRALKSNPLLFPAETKGGAK